MDTDAHAASDSEMNGAVRVTAAGLASAAQLTDLTAFMTVTMDQEAAVRPLVIMTREPAPSYLKFLQEPRASLTWEDDPVLAKLWDNDEDAVFDTL